MVTKQGTEAYIQDSMLAHLRKKQRYFLQKSFLLHPTCQKTLDSVPIVIPANVKGVMKNKDVKANDWQDYQQIYDAFFIHALFSEGVLFIPFQLTEYSLESERLEEN